MAEIGRNAPCPCGSGKKYKHCCLKRDVARGQDDLVAAAREAPPSREASAEHRFRDDTGGSDQDALEASRQETEEERFRERADSEVQDAEESPEDEEDRFWVEFWRDLRRAAPEEKARMVDRMIEVTDDFDGELAFGLLEAVMDPLQRAGRADDVDRLIRRIEELRPEAYKAELRWMSFFRARNALCQQDGDVGAPLALLAQQPGSIDELFRLNDRLLYHGRVQELTPVMVAALPEVLRSDEVTAHGKWEFREITFTLLLDKHLARDPELRWDDPAFLQETAPVRAMDDEWLQRIVAHAGGTADRAWRPEDFQGPLDERRSDDLFFLTVDFGRALHCRWDWPRSRAEQARRMVVDYVAEDSGKRSGRRKSLLRFDPDSADAFLASCFRMVGAAPYRAAAFNQALLPWMRFLCDLRLMDRNTVPGLVQSMKGRTQNLPRLLDHHVYDPILIELTQRAWAEAP